MNGLRLHTVSYRYGSSGTPAVEHCSLEIPVGSLYAVLGPNGAGKTTLLRLLAGKLRPVAGHVEYPEAWCGSDGVLAARNYGLLIENPGAYRRLSIREYLRFFGIFYALPDLEERITEDCGRLSLYNTEERLGTLSLGNLQKVHLVRALLHRPRLVLLDEPVSNLDPIGRENVWKWLKELVREQGMTAIVCSHVLGEIADVCDNVAIMRAGRMVVAGSLEHVLQSRGSRSRVEIRGVTDEENLITLETFFTFAPTRDIPERIQALVENHQRIVEVLVQRPDLADVYRACMGEPYAN